MTQCAEKCVHLTFYGSYILLFPLGFQNRGSLAHVLLEEDGESGFYLENNFGGEVDMY